MHSKFQAIDSRDMPVAYLYTPDEEYIHPLREFLESSQCRVYVNSDTQSDSRYFIVCGDREFVKAILVRFTEIDSRILIIVWENLSKESAEDLSPLGKTVTINRSTDLKKHINDIFTFFFTSRLRYFSLYKLVEHSGFSIPKPTQKPIEERDLEKVQDIHKTPLSREPPSIQETAASFASDSERIRKTIESVYKSDDGNRYRAINDHKQDKAKRHVMFPVLLIILVFIAPYVWYAISLTFSLLTLGLSVRYLKSGNTGLTKTTVNAAGHWINQSKTSLMLIGLPFRLLTLTQPLNSQELTISFVSDSSDALRSMTKLLESTRLLTKSVFPDLYDPSMRNGSLPVLVDSYKTNLPYVIDRLGLAEAELDKLIKDRIFPFSMPAVAPAVSGVKTEIATGRMRMGVFQKLLSLYTEAGGFRKQATYLILFQNSMELRPTGGFIGSLAELSLLDGGIETFKVYDVYDIDGQLKGHSDPPEPIRRILGQEHWYLRDSNWDPDFTVSGRAAAWFYEKSTGRKVDGVIAINSPFVTDILKGTGPVFLPDFNDTVTSENFYGKALYYIEQSFFPGSTGKKDFLGSLMNALILSVNKPEQSNAYLLAKAFEDALNSRDIQFYFREPELENLVRQYGWSGAWISDDLCLSGSEKNPKCYADFIGVVDANLSLNKVNYFVTRTQASEIRFMEGGGYLSTTKLMYENTSSGKSGEGGGNYRNYERIYLPPDVSDVRLSLEGKEVPRKPETDEGIVIFPYFSESTASSSFKAYEVAYDVPSGSQKTLEISYGRPQIPVSGSDFLYDLSIPKQPGLESANLSVRFVYPNSFSPEVKSYVQGSLVANEGTLEYNSVLSQDERIRIVFSVR